MRVLLVGQAPSRVMSKGERPFEGTAALTRLATYAGVAPRERLYELFDFVNVIEDWPGALESNKKYDAFPKEQAKAGKERVYAHIIKTAPDRVVTLGRAVTDVVRVRVHPRLPWFGWEEMKFGDAVAFMAASPHPGGTSMYWNSPDARALGEYFWRSLVDRIENG